MNENKRKEFYLSTDVWMSGLSCHAKAVLAYLSYCADKQGECFPSVRKIAEECSVCKNTVRKALCELENKGLVAITPRIVRSSVGNRQTSNMYLLLTERGKRKPLSPEAAKEKPAESPAAKEKPPENSAAAEDPEGEAELAALLDRLELRRLYGDTPLGKAMELAISELWRSDNFCFKGERIPKQLVRKRLSELDTDAMDQVTDAFGNYDKSDPAAFMKACIYNAPLKSSARQAANIIEYRAAHDVWKGG